MPSEMIYGSGGHVDVRVAWGINEEGTVQVATLATDEDPTDRLLIIVNGWLADAGMTEIDLAALRAKLPYKPHFDGWHATLSEWAAVNRLIKALRRARDRQFGEPA